jgi:hypothetical protein
MDNNRDRNMPSKIQVHQTVHGYEWTLYVKDQALLRSSGSFPSEEAAMKEARYWEQLTHTPVGQLRNEALVNT